MKLLFVEAFEDFFDILDDNEGNIVYLMFFSWFT